MFSIFSQRTATEPVSESKSGSGWLGKLKAGLAKTRAVLSADIGDLLASGSQIDEALFERLETALLSGDVGVRTSGVLIEQLRRAVKDKKITAADALDAEFKAALTSLVAPLEQALDCRRARPFVIMVAGVNGAGKTTTIGKLAKYFQSQGLSVMLAAGDTFRAAARAQLVTWGERNNVCVIAQDGGDSAAIIFDAVNAAKARGIDVVLADTAGRLPTQLHLMEEIKKVKRVIAKADPLAPHEVMLILDANTGQNALSQVKVFDDALGLTGLVVTKLDGTAKGGMIASLATERRAQGKAPIPVRFIGVGEAIDDLQPFVAKDFVDALF